MLDVLESLLALELLLQSVNDALPPLDLLLLHVQPPLHRHDILVLLQLGRRGALLRDHHITDVVVVVLAGHLGSLCLRHTMRSADRTGTVRQVPRDDLRPATLLAHLVLLTVECLARDLAEAGGREADLRWVLGVRLGYWRVKPIHALEHFLVRVEVLLDSAIRPAARSDQVPGSCDLAVEETCVHLMPAAHHRRLFMLVEL